MRNACVLSVFDGHPKRTANALLNRVRDVQNCLRLYFRSFLENANLSNARNHVGDRLDTGSENSIFKSNQLYVSVCPNDHLRQIFLSQTKMEGKTFS